MLDLRIDSGEIKAQLPKMLRLEFATLEFDHYLTAQLQVIEQQVDKKFVTADIEQYLTADEGKACAACRAKISRPICQYSSTSSRLTASVVRCCDAWTRLLRSVSQSA